MMWMLSVDRARLNKVGTSNIIIWEYQLIDFSYQKIKYLLFIKHASLQGSFFFFFCSVPLKYIPENHLTEFSIGLSNG